MAADDLVPGIVRSSPGLIFTMCIENVLIWGEFQKGVSNQNEAII